MEQIAGRLLVVASLMFASTSMAAAQVVQGTGVGGTLRITVLDQTEAALVIAQVTVVDANGVEHVSAVDSRGLAVFENLNPGTYQVKATAESFRPIATPITVRRGDNRTTLRLAVATIEQTVVVPTSWPAWPALARRSLSMASVAAACRRKTRFSRFASTLIRSRPSITRPA